MTYPSSPSVGDTHVEGGIQRRWDGKRWAINSGLVINEGGGGDVATFNNKGNAGPAVTVTVTDHKYQQITLNSATCTVTVAGTPAAGEVNECVLRIVHDATTNSRALSWSGVDAWPNNTAPFFPAIENGGRIYVTLITFPDGTCEGFPGGSFY